MSSKPLNPTIAAQILKIVGDLGDRVSFRAVWLEARRRGVLSWDRAVRSYLDLNGVPVNSSGIT